MEAEKQQLEDGIAVRTSHFSCSMFAFGSSYARKVSMSSLAERVCIRCSGDLIKRELPDYRYQKHHFQHYQVLPQPPGAE